MVGSSRARCAPAHPFGTGQVVIWRDQSRVAPANDARCPFEHNPTSGRWVAAGYPVAVAHKRLWGLKSNSGSLTRSLPIGTAESYLRIVSRFLGSLSGARRVRSRLAMLEGLPC